MFIGLDNLELQMFILICKLLKLSVCLFLSVEHHICAVAADLGEIQEGPDTKSKGM